MHLLVTFYLIEFDLGVAYILHFLIINLATDDLLNRCRVVISSDSVDLVLSKRLLLVSVLVWSVNQPNFLLDIICLRKLRSHLVSWRILVCAWS